MMDRMASKSALEQVSVSKDNGEQRGQNVGTGNMIFDGNLLYVSTKQDTYYRSETARRIFQLDFGILRTRN
jgi:hypothetical protein